MTSVADKLADYLRTSIANEPKWHYAQVRPMRNFGVPPDREQTTDCSGQSTSAYFWAGAPDPNPGCNYNGTGYTGTLVNNPKVSAPYQIGDLGIYGTSLGNTTHVVTCYAPGDAASADWCSHGSEAAPYGVALHYRSDLLCVVRPGLGDGSGGGGDVSIPEWYWPWADWYLNTKRAKDERPEAAPDKIPDWAWDYLQQDEKIANHRGMTEGERDWVVWYLDGKEGERPKVPQTIPERWWDDAEYVQAQRRVGDPGKP